MPRPSARLRGPGAVAILACLAATGVGVLADAGREQEGPSRVDPVVAADVLRLRTPRLTELADVLTFLGSEVVVGGSALAVLAALLVLRRFGDAVTFAIAVGGSVCLTVAVKTFVARPRPGAVDRLGAVDTTSSFPSGHTLNTAVLLALVVWLLWPTVRYAGHVALVAAAAVLTVGVASSRVYLGYHWLTDVLGSGLVALAWLCLVWLSRPAISRATSLRLRARDDHVAADDERRSPARPDPRGTAT